MLQTTDFAALAAMIGPVYSGYAIENNKITQAESAFEGFMSVFYTPMSLAEIVPYRTELNCPSYMPGYPGKKWSIFRSFLVHFQCKNF